MESSCHTVYFLGNGINEELMDLLAFVFHRPRFFGKAFLAFVTQGIYGGNSVVKYLEKVGGFWGFNVVKDAV
jgi:hypothetical protein